MEVKVGERVQAIDELCRWENGKIVDIAGDYVTVKFTGWDDTYNVTRLKDNIRSPLQLNNLPSKYSSYIVCLFYPSVDLITLDYS